MLQVSEKEIKNRLSFENPWWKSSQGIDSDIRSLPKRAYFGPFFRLVTQTDVRRAVILLGPRRVGKTVILKQTIQSLLDSGVPPKSIFYVSIDNPTYTGVGLEQLLNLFVGHDVSRDGQQRYVLFDEVQYLKDWEVHLKSLVDSYPNVRFVCSGSAAAALRFKSRDSGAGRFTEFMLPPLMFSEFLGFTDREEMVFDTQEDTDGSRSRIFIKDISKLNGEFFRYLNIGGLPEAVYSKTIQEDMERYVRDDIIDKVLLRDLPSLYGIGDTQGLNRLFATIAYNTGGEASLEGLSNTSGVAKNTIRKHLDYLEAAFLIHRVHRIDENARNYKRVTQFKLYLTNPCLRTSLFGPIDEEDDAMGRLAESALYGQLIHSSVIDELRYARWRSGEVDMVKLDRASQRPQFAVEAKWSDRYVEKPQELKPLIKFCKTNKLTNAYVTTRTVGRNVDVDGITIHFSPLAFWCYWINKNTIEPDLDSGLHPRTGLPLF